MPIKVTASAISAPLSSIVNNSFDQCKFSTKPKFAEVKKNSQLEKNNYRPVSILTCLSKVIEICMNHLMKDFSQAVLSALISAY